MRNFVYDGQGPDAFLLAGTNTDGPSETGDVVLPYPFTGNHYQYQANQLSLFYTNIQNTIELRQIYLYEIINIFNLDLDWRMHYPYSVGKRN